MVQSLLSVTTELGVEGNSTFLLGIDWIVIRLVRQGRSEERQLAHLCRSEIAR